MGVDPAQVNCGTCKAVVGSTCRTIKGAYTAPHGSRILTARGAAAPAAQPTSARYDQARYT